MATKNFKQLTKAEEQVMQVLWKLNKATTHEIIEALTAPKPHYNTVSTILKILVEKDFVSVDLVGKTNFYSPLVSKDNYRKGSMNQFVDKYFSGSFKSMVSFFAKEENLSMKDLGQILNELQKK